MRIAALYDIHANLPALEAVLQEVSEVNADLIVVGGDVLPGPFPQETIQVLLDVEIPIEFIHGNGDREVLAQIDGVESDWYRKSPEAWREPVRWTAEQIQSTYRRLLSGWPRTYQAGIPGLGDVLFCHATPHNDTDIFTRLTPEDRLLPLFQGLGFSIVICGHTHMQFDRMVGTTRVVNAGSVGMPFGEPGADWLLLGPGVHFRHTPYDFLRAAERIRLSTYPQASDFAEHSVLHPPTAEQSLAAFSHAELK